MRDIHTMVGGVWQRYNSSAQGGILTVSRHPLKEFFVFPIDSSLCKREESIFKSFYDIYRFMFSFNSNELLALSE